MFDDLLRELRRLEQGKKVEVSIQTDDDGYFDRKCPSQECQFEFKVHFEDWRDKVRDEEVFCPFCGHSTASSEWCTEEQHNHLKQIAIGHIQQSLGGAMKRDADRWNRQQPRNSFVSVTMSVNSAPRRISLPPAAADPMRLKITCGECTCRYAVIGAAFFCPSCGHNAADLTFSQAIGGIRASLDALNDVRAAIPDSDTAENTVRLLKENGLQNAITAFQRYAEALYGRFPAAPVARRNAFQNLTEGSELWNQATGKTFGAYLDRHEASALAKFFQQRHVLAHRQGLVDDDYIKRTEDSHYRAGQRIVIRESAVRECISLVDKLTAGMAADAQPVKDVTIP